MNAVAREFAKRFRALADALEPYPDARRAVAQAMGNALPDGPAGHETRGSVEEHHAAARITVEYTLCQACQPKGRAACQQCRENAGVA